MGLETSSHWQRRYPLERLLGVIQHQLAGSVGRCGFFVCVEAVRLLRGEAQGKAASVLQALWKGRVGVDPQLLKRYALRGERPGRQAPGSLAPSIRDMCGLTMQVSTDALAG